MSGLASSGVAPSWSAALRAHGLSPRHGKPGYRNGKLRFDVVAGWPTFEVRTSRVDSLRGGPAAAGLWRLVGDGRSTARRVFELPPCFLPRHDSQSATFRELTAWALGTAADRGDRPWTPPTPEEIARWLPEHALTLQVGEIARKGTMTLEGDRLEFGFPLVARIPRDLPTTRKQWLRELLTDAQRRWRMVRIGLTRDGEARASVDVGGAPRQALEPLVRIGVDALRLVVASLVGPAELVVHGAAGSRGLKTGPNRVDPGTTRKEKS